MEHFLSKQKTRPRDEEEDEEDEAVVEEEESEFSHFEDNEEFVGYNDDKVWLLTQFHSVDSLQSRIGVKKCIFNTHPIKVCVSCC